MPIFKLLLSRRKAQKLIDKRGRPLLFEARPFENEQSKVLHAQILLLFFPQLRVPVCNTVKMVRDIFCVSEMQCPVALTHLSDWQNYFG